MVDHKASPDRAISGGADEGCGLQAHEPCLCSAEWSATWPCHLLAPALPAKEGQDVGRDTPPLAQAAPGKEDFSSSPQVTKLAWLKSTSYPSMLLMVAQGPVKGQEGEEAGNGLRLLQRGRGT